MKHLLLILLSLFIAGTTFAQRNAKKTDTTYVGKYIKIHSITPHLYRYICNNGQIPSNGLVYVDSNEAVMIDAPQGNGVTDSLMSWIEHSLKATLTGVIITHWHEQDRMGGLAAVNNKGITSYSQQQTIDIAKSKKLPVPQIGFTDSITLMAGNRCIECIYPGKGHTADNIVVWFPEERVLFGGCLVKDMNAKDLGYTADADLKLWPAAIHHVLRMYPQARIVVPGHNDYGSKRLLMHTMDLLKAQRS